MSADAAGEGMIARVRERRERVEMRDVSIIIDKALRDLASVKMEKFSNRIEKRLASISIYKYVPLLRFSWHLRLVCRLFLSNPIGPST